MLSHLQLRESIYHAGRWRFVIAHGGHDTLRVDSRAFSLMLSLLQLLFHWGLREYTLKPVKKPSWEAIASCGAASCCHGDLPIEFISELWQLLATTHARCALSCGYYGDLTYVHEQSLGNHKWHWPPCLWQEHLQPLRGLQRCQLLPLLRPHQWCCLSGTTEVSWVHVGK